MSDYDNGFARAQAMYDAQEQPDNSRDMCKCGYMREEHYQMRDFAQADKEYEVCPEEWEELIKEHTFTEEEYEPEYDTLEEKADAEGGD
mgnify:FL=1